ncbi:MAG TPA: hypothetical protein PKA44_05735 [Saprospiraceae bacterium]|nr:hypothetical protein [Saprospiraceae bacterium]HQU96912.1 hypothetical protein [Saprospiraceae bacterium]HQW95593.1 hypothetical protein [Saprospiraceae bacterium]HRG43955.1 hypothetical protein [Saprospiraceae bacterium]
MMRIIGIVLSIFALLAGCSNDEEKMRPGERYTVDTLMFHHYRSIDSVIDKECQKITEGIYRKAYDSLLRIRVKDIKSIKGNGLPPPDNRFPKVLNQLESKEKPTQIPANKAKSPIQSQKNK